MRGLSMSTGFSILSAQSSTLRQDMANRKGNRTGWTPVQKSRWFLSAIVIGLFGSIMSEPKPGQRSSVFGFSRFIWGLVIVGQAENARWRVRGTGFEPPERRSLCSLVPCFESSFRIHDSHALFESRSARDRIRTGARNARSQQFAARSLQGSLRFCSSLTSFAHARDRIRTGGPLRDSVLSALAAKGGKTNPNIGF